MAKRWRRRQTTTEACKGNVAPLDCTCNKVLNNIDAKYKELVDKNCCSETISSRKRNGVLQTCRDRCGRKPLCQIEVDIDQDSDDCHEFAKKPPVEFQCVLAKDWSSISKPKIHYSIDDEITTSKPNDDVSSSTATSRTTSTVTDSYKTAETTHIPISGTPWKNNSRITRSNTTYDVMLTDQAIGGTVEGPLKIGFMAGEAVACTAGLVLVLMLLVYISQRRRNPRKGNHGKGQKDYYEMDEDYYASVPDEIPPVPTDHSYVNIGNAESNVVAENNHFGLGSNNKIENQPKTIVDNVLYGSKE